MQHDVSSSLRFPKSPVSRHHLHAIARIAGMLACVCAILIAPLLRAFPIYTAQEEPQTDSWPSASPAVANAMALGRVVADLDTDFTSGILAAMPTETSYLSSIDVRYRSTIEGTSLAEAPLPDAELQSLTIAGMQYSTGFDPSDCSAEAGIGACNAIEDAFYVLALAWDPGQSSRLE